MEWNIVKLWNSFDEGAWNFAESELYDCRVREGRWDIELERELEQDGLRDRIATMSPREVLRLATRQILPLEIRGSVTSDTSRLDLPPMADRPPSRKYGQVLIRPNGRSIREMIETVTRISGLGVKAASGLLALAHPERYATVDVRVLQSFHAIGMFNDVRESDIKVEAAVEMIEAMRAKARELNAAFGNINKWTPRKIDRVLWAVRGKSFDYVPKSSARRRIAMANLRPLRTALTGGSFLLQQN